MNTILLLLVAIILIVIVSSLLLIRKSNSNLISTDKDCIVKVATPATCNNGNYNIVYDISENELGNGKDCLSVIKSIDPRPTYTLTNNQYIGTTTCGDCVLSGLTSTNCTDDKITLSTDITSTPGVIGTSCESIIASLYPKYKSLFNKEGNSYVAQANCNICDVTLNDTTCGDCALTEMANTECSNNNQSLSLNITNAPSIVGKSCESLITSTYPSYSSYFNKSGNSYTADISCNNCEISLGSSSSICLGNRGLTSYDISSTTTNSEYGNSCSVTASKLNPPAIYDASKNIVYYYTSNCTTPTSISGYNFYTYGFITSNKRQSYSTTNPIDPLITLYFDTQDPLTSRLVGIQLPEFQLLSDGKYLNNIGDGTLIKVGTNSTIYNKPTSMAFPITLYTDQYYVVITANWSGMNVSYLSWGISGINLDFTYTLYNLNGTKIGEKTMTYAMA